MTDESGDRVYLLAERREGDVAVGGGGRGVQRIVGGTGRYAGVTGDCPYTTSHLPDRWLVSRGTTRIQVQASSPLLRHNDEQRGCKHYFGDGLPLSYRFLSWS